MGKTIAVSNMKGGVGKTMTATSLAAGLVRQGKSVLCIDADPQHSLSVCLGITTEVSSQSITIRTIMSKIIEEEHFNQDYGIFHHDDGFDIIPADKSLGSLEISLAGIIERETILREYIDMVKLFYDYIIIDCAPSLGLLTINALAAADEVIIPVIPRFLDAKGLELLLNSIARLQRNINPTLTISGILLTMVERRANFTKEIMSMLEGCYGEKIRIFNEVIPSSVRASESTYEGVSIFTYDPSGKLAKAYAALVREVLSDAA